MSKGDTHKKQAYFEKVHHLFRTYSKIFIVNVDNVTSTQMHQIRASLRSEAVILMGKNTLVRKAMREVLQENPDLEALVPYIWGNVGLVFTNGDLKTVREKIVANRISAAAKIGLIAQNDIYIPGGNTGIDPNKTSFFQALGISTKVVKGAIEIMSDVLIVKTGQKVGASEAALMNMLNLVPFSFGLTALYVYENGAVFDPKMLDVTDDVLAKYLKTAISNVAALSIKLGVPTVASAPHMLANAFKNVIGLTLVTEYSFPAAEKIRDRVMNPQAYASAAVASAPAASKAAPAAAAAAAPKEESDEDMGFGLFD